MSHVERGEELPPAHCTTPGGSVLRPAGQILKRHARSETTQGGGKGIEGRLPELDPGRRAGELTYSIDDGVRFADGANNLAIYKPG
jgi:hypothetical protein